AGSAGRRDQSYTTVSAWARPLSRDACRPPGNVFAFDAPGAFAFDSRLFARDHQCLNPLPRRTRILVRGTGEDGARTPAFGGRQAPGAPGAVIMTVGDHDNGWGTLDQAAASRQRRGRARRRRTGPGPPAAAPAGGTRRPRPEAAPLPRRAAVARP